MKESKTKKPMKLVAIKDDFTEEVAGFFIDAISNNTAPWMKPWVAADYVFPFNPVTKTVYKGFNNFQLSLLQEMKFSSSDPRWMTYNNARDSGYQVKLGSKSTVIMYASVLDLDDNGKLITPENKDTVKKDHSIIARKYYNVFHASQIQGIEPFLKEASITDAVKYEGIDTADAILKNSLAKIFNDQRDRCFYKPSTDEIHLVSKSKFSTSEEYYSTALHELAHWTGSSSRLARNIENTFGTTEYAQEELRAEIGSFMLCKSIGLDFNPQQSGAYVQSWCKELKNKPEEILKACHDAESIKTYCMLFSNKNEKENTQRHERVMSL